MKTTGTPSADSHETSLHRGLQTRQVQAGGTAPSGARAASTAPVGLPTLRLGDTGVAVSLLQRLLDATAAEGEAHPITIDGEFGDETELAVALHQTEARLDSDGVCGEKTWASFCREEMWGIDRIGRQIIDDPSSDDGKPDSMPPIPLTERSRR